MVVWVGLGGQRRLLCNNDMLPLSRALSDIREQACRYLGVGGRVFQEKGTIVQQSGGGRSVLRVAKRQVWPVGSEVGKGPTLNYK